MKLPRCLAYALAILAGFAIAAAAGQVLGWLAFRLLGGGS